MYRGLLFSFCSDILGRTLTKTFIHKSFYGHTLRVHNIICVMGFTRASSRHPSHKRYHE